MIIGQNELRNKIDNLIISGFPNVSTILSNPGLGKSTIINYICEKLEISDKLYLDKIEVIKNSYSYVNDKIHKVALIVPSFEGLNFRAKETLLKLCEDLKSNAYVFIEVSNIASYDDRFLNRSQLFELSPYSKDEAIEIINLLNNNIDNDDIKKLMMLFNTPKDFYNALNEIDNLDNFIDFIYKVVNNIYNASTYNAMKILNSLSTKSDDNKIDFYLFFKAVSSLSFRTFYKNREIKYYKIFNSANLVITDLSLCKTLNKNMLFDKFIFNLKETC